MQVSQLIEILGTQDETMEIALTVDTEQAALGDVRLGVVDEDNNIGVILTSG